MNEPCETPKQFPPIPRALRYMILVWVGYFVASSVYGPNWASPPEKLSMEARIYLKQSGWPHKYVNDVVVPDWPQSTRLITPGVINLVPLSPPRAFVLWTGFCLSLALVLYWSMLRNFGLNSRMALMTIALYLSTYYPINYYIQSPFTTDPLFILFWVAVMFLIEREAPMLLVGLACLAGMMNKESFVIMFFYWFAREYVHPRHPMRWPTETSPSPNANLTPAHVRAMGSVVGLSVAFVLLYFGICRIVNSYVNGGTAPFSLSTTWMRIPAVLRQHFSESGRTVFVKDAVLAGAVTWVLLVTARRSHVGTSIRVLVAMIPIMMLPMMMFATDVGRQIAKFGPLLWPCVVIAWHHIAYDRQGSDAPADGAEPRGRRLPWLFGPACWFALSAFGNALLTVTIIAPLSESAKLFLHWFALALLLLGLGLPIYASWTNPSRSRI